jgi:hypothetical protein
MRKYITRLSLLVTLVTGMTTIQSCEQQVKADPAKEKAVIASLLDSFNIAAAKADYNKYFGYFAEDAVFMGTDATERWTKTEFMKWAKPFCDRGPAWDFTAVKREIFLDGTGSMAWFDELLSTQMKICRGSGVLVKQGGNWKISQYVLSATVPNTILDTVVVMKTAEEDSLLKTIRK